MKMKYLYTFLVVILVFNVACNRERESEGSKKLAEEIKLVTTAMYETDPVAQRTSEDAADDPAIWIHPDSTKLSKVIGTDKKGGLGVYNLKGEELFYYPFGNLNNVDVRYNFPLNSDSIDLVVASNRSTHALAIYKINLDGSLEDISAHEIPSQMKDEVYGFCLYKSPDSNKYYAFMNSKAGEIEQWELFATGDSKVDAKLVRNFNVNTQVEGMVADDENKTVFLGEETVGIFKFDAEPTNEINPVLVPMSSTVQNSNIHFDIEGLSIYYLENGEGYLLASSQGNYSYAVFNRKSPHQYLGSFRIVDGVVDGTEETDGIDIYSGYLNEDFKHGLFVAQDGYNKDGDKALPQNFKLVPWENIAKLFPDVLHSN